MKPDPESPEFVFDKTKIASMMRVGNEVLTNIKFNQFKHDEDCFIRNELVIRMEADLYKATGLKFQYDTFKEHIQRLSSGAGDYLVQGFKNGIPKVLKSLTVPFKTDIQSPEHEGLEELEETFDKIDKLNDEETN